MKDVKTERRDISRLEVVVATLWRGTRWKEHKAIRGTPGHVMYSEAFSCPANYSNASELVRCSSCSSYSFVFLPPLTLEYTPDCILEAMGMQPFQIGQVAQKTGLSVDAIRFYEREGLVPRPARTKGGYRLYRQPEIADLEFIQKAQQLGFSLKEIRELFSIQRHPQETCVHVRDLIAQKLAVVRGKIQELKTIEAALVASLRQCRKALRRPAGHRDSCPVLDQIAARPQRKKT
jgi:DNA-binding transcriptional MerR regulator